MRISQYSRFFPACRWLVILIIFFFISRAVYHGWSGIQGFSLTCRPLILAASIAVYCCYLFFSAALWHLLTLFNRVAISFHKGITAWFYSMLARYIPGKIFSWAGRVYYYNNEGECIKKITFCFLMEFALQLLASCLIIILTLSAIPLGQFENFRAGAGILIIFLLVIIHPKVLQLLLNTFLVWSGREKIEMALNYRIIFLTLCLYLVNGLVSGYSFYLLVNAFYPVRAENYFFLTASFLLAAWLGILSFFAPAGLGVRDGVLLVALNLLMPDAISAITVLIARIWTTICELICVALIFLFNYLFDPSRKTE